MAINEGLGRRLRRTITIQSVAIGIVSVIGVWAAAFLIENVLIVQALEDEAEHYWALLERDSATPAPNTRNLMGYLVAPGRIDPPVPEALRQLGPGHHSVPSDFDLKLVYVTVREDSRLVLVFEGAQVRELSLLFGLAPLGLVLVLVYVIAWLSYRATRRAVSPVEWLARQVNALDLQRPNPDAFDLTQLNVTPDSEVLDMANALSRLTQRVNDLVDRERNFTRDASHELRSPLTVMRMAADMLLTEGALDERSRALVERIKRAAKDMVDLVEAFLLLARESELGVEFDWVCINDVVRDEVERTRLLSAERDVRIRFVEEKRMLVETSDKVVAVLIGNLVRNAVDYTEVGEVVVRIGDRFVEICDSGPGMAGHEVSHAFDAFFRGRAQGRGTNSGYGVGLTIVKRLSARFEWPVTIDSEVGQGTRVTVQFPTAVAST